MFRGTAKIGHHASSLTRSMSAHAQDTVVFANHHAARVISLNRVSKLNSLDTTMINHITPRLLEYAKSTANNVVVLTSNSPKALCAGGDVARCASEIGAGNAAYAADFFQREYNLNYLIATYSKPYVALMDGITFGGGVGLSVHAPFRVATEKTKVAMPEMDIGFFPDVGTTFFLPRLDDKLGYYYAMTGDILSGIDAYLVGFATHYVRAEKLPQLISRLASLEPPIVNDHKTVASEVIHSNAEYFAQVNHAIDEFAESKLPEGAKFPFSPEELKIINAAFSQPSVDAIFDYLNKEGSEFALATAAKLAKKPTSSLKTAYELMNRGLSNTIKQQFELELVTATNLVNAPAAENDFYKGVHHKLIAKIKEPAYPEWNKASSITESYLKKLTAKSKHTETLATPLIDKFFNIDYKQYPYNMGLPRNTDVAAYITGNDGSNRAYLPTPNEVVAHFRKQTNNKLGVEAKVQSVLAVHGEGSKYDEKYVSWKD